MDDSRLHQAWIDFGFRSRTRPVDRMANMENLARHIRGEICFLSYRGHSIQRATRVKQHLEQRVGVKECILIPPGLLCRENEVRRPIDYLKLVADLREYIKRATFFLYLHRDGFLDSYWTRMEVAVRAMDHPVFFGIDFDDNGNLGGDGLQTGGDRTLATYMRTFMKVATDPRLQNAVGKFARDYLVIPCGHCGDHFLLSEALAAARRTGTMIRCPSCAEAIRIWSESGRYLVDCDISAAAFLHPDDILSLVAIRPAYQHITSGQERVCVRMTGREFLILR